MKYHYLKAHIFTILTFFAIITAIIPPNFASAHPRRTPVVEAYQKNKDAVVSVSSKYVAEVPVQDPFWFWGQNDWPFARRRVEVPSLGSGFIINSRGYIVTNAHVIEHAQQIEVVMADKSRHPARKIAVDKSADLGILKIDTDKPLPTVTLGRSDNLMIGETVLAIGNPFGYQQTLTDGIISAIHRDIRLSDNVSLPDLIQISAPINPGNSGGPLLNINGELIGINTAIRKAAQGIGFAIPIETLRKTLPRMLSHNIQQQHRIELGFAVTDNTDNAMPAEHSDANAGKLSIRGAKVISLAAGNPNYSDNVSAAYTQGNHNSDPENSAANTLHLNDIITAVNDIRITNAIDFYLAMLEQKPNSIVNLQIYRQDKNTHKTKILTAELLLHKRPEPDPAALARNLFGLEIDSLTASMLQKYQLSGKRGSIVIMGVQNGSPAHKAGIVPGDIILAIGNIPVRDMKTLGSCLEQIPPAATVTMMISRGRIQNGMSMIRQFYCTVQARNPSEQVQEKQTPPIEKSKQKYKRPQERVPL